MDLLSCLGHRANSDELKRAVQSLHGPPKSNGIIEGDIKVYRDGVYINHYALGFSLFFEPVKGYQLQTRMPSSDVDYAQLQLASLDIYNPSKDSKKVKFGTFTGLPLRVTAGIELASDTTGKQIVKALGEPDRKGGGAGPQGASMGVWIEYTSLGLMLEFSSSGLGSWDTAATQAWSVATLFPPTHDSAREEEARMLSVHEALRDASTPA
ncbi:uncharacterized protein L969DRAFT_86499 [Mixia osmundae IAM 14324]|uniref:uncharacterized protein n=1 Tax=Mixia osmundae (strain CBS 9802 / IAM 14324 / JCM 22182 / KY 12970) TaxID=764103 RepID=UPI0004A55628|nr:uncharacterized protein L969DRAFT_86499 [Mixia osmundae IAM 14324]KEI39903.1 hypothetical protein L969DRAFT_86499 [Mixia osmundae IAM 14324]